MFVVRNFRGEDQSAVKKVVALCMKNLFPYSDINYKGVCKSLPDLYDIKSNYLDCGGMFLVAELDSKIIGTIAFLPEKNSTARLKRFYLYKKYRGKGFGSIMYDHAERLCRQKGFSRIMLSTYTDFRDALKLYTHKGFRVSGKLPDNRIILSKKLH